MNLPRVPVIGLTLFRPEFSNVYHLKIVCKTYYVNVSTSHLVTTYPQLLPVRPVVFRPSSTPWCSPSVRRSPSPRHYPSSPVLSRSHTCPTDTDIPHRTLSVDTTTSPRHRTNTTPNVLRRFLRKYYFTVLICTCNMVTVIGPKL